MLKQRTFYRSILILLCSTALVSSATVTFDIQPASGDASQEIVVDLGSTIAYEITALVTSDDPDTPDHNGLSYFSVDVLTDLGVVQNPVDELDADIAAVFTYMVSLGLSSDDDILEIRASQDVLLGPDALTLNIATDQKQVLARGELIAPNTVGTFTVSISAQSRANVFATWNTSEMMLANTAIAAGMTIRTQVGAGNNTGNNTGNSNNQGDQTTDTGTTTDLTQYPIASATLGLLGAAALVAGALLLFGPMVSGIVLVLALALLTMLAALGGV